MLSHGLSGLVLIQEVVLPKRCEQGRKRLLVQVNDQIDILRQLLHAVKRAGDRASQVIQHVQFFEGMPSRKHDREQVYWLKVPALTPLKGCLHALDEARSIGAGEHMQGRFLLAGLAVALSPCMDG
jgi:hypothetical protein